MELTPMLYMLLESFPQIYPCKFVWGSILRNPHRLTYPTAVDWLQPCKKLPNMQKVDHSFVKINELANSFLSPVSFFTSFSCLFGFIGLCMNPFILLNLTRRSPVSHKSVWLTLSGQSIFLKIELWARLKLVQNLKLKWPSCNHAWFFLCWQRLE